MKLRLFSPKFAVTLSCVSIAAFVTLTASADPEERTGSDAPHHERNLAKNERKTALPLSEVTVPAFADKPVRKATAVKTTSSERKSKDKKKAEQQAAKAKAKTENAVTSTVDDRPRYDDVEDRVGSDAPHQERATDSSKHGARLFILER